MNTEPSLWIAYNPSIHDPRTNREQFNGDRPAWGESLGDHNAKQGVEIPEVGDQLTLRMGRVTVESRRLESPEVDDDGVQVTGWYWTILVRP